MVVRDGIGSVSRFSDLMIGCVLSRLCMSEVIRW